VETFSTFTSGVIRSRYWKMSHFFRQPALALIWQVESEYAYLTVELS